MNIRENLRIIKNIERVFTDIHEYSYISMNMHECSKVSMNIHKYPWIFIEIHSMFIQHASDIHWIFNPYSLLEHSSGIH